MWSCTPRTRARSSESRYHSPRRVRPEDALEREEADGPTGSSALVLPGKPHVVSCAILPSCALAHRSIHSSCAILARRDVAIGVRWCSVAQPALAHPTECMRLYVLARAFVRRSLRMS